MQSLSDTIVQQLIRTTVNEQISTATMDTSSFAPKPFRGAIGEDVESFLTQFNKYVDFKELSPSKALALCKVLLQDGAGDWLLTLRPAVSGHLKALQDALMDRYGKSQLVRHKTARELFSRKQGPDEDLEKFVSSCTKLSRSFGDQSESMAMYAIMGGLRPALASFVAQKQPRNLRELIECARLGDLTVGSVSDSEQRLLFQMSEMKAEMQRLGDKLQQATTAHIGQPSPTQQRRVAFDDDQSGRNRQSGSSYPTYGRRGGSRWSTRRPMSGRQPGNQSQQQTQAEDHECSRCGAPGGHSHPNRCRAFNLSCRYCIRVGHFAVKCRQAARDRQLHASQQQQ
jgi:hypothetical protein